MSSDICSRLKRLERAVGNCDIDERYSQDRCASLFHLLDNKGANEIGDTVEEPGLPVVKSQLRVFKCALKKYVEFVDDTMQTK